MKFENIKKNTPNLRKNLLFSYVNHWAMHTKLTLNIEKAVIEQAKLYAKQQNLSLSKLIEAYLKSLTLQGQSTHEPSPLVQELTGIIAKSYNEKDAYQAYQNQKHA
ncbi:MAG: hypothetical protein RLZZ289_1373 [Bacteroidota bacterium]|jgi:hypothetical protein